MERKGGERKLMGETEYVKSKEKRDVTTGR